jgi:hypothetical protein
VPELPAGTLVHDDLAAFADWLLAHDSESLSANVPAPN